MKAQAQIKFFIKGKLATDSRWAIKALMAIYRYQTEDEQKSDATLENNGVGFTGVDAEFLTSLAKQYQRKGSLSDKQLEYLMKKIPKYWFQIARISDQSKLAAMLPEKQLL